MAGAAVDTAAQVHHGLHRMRLSSEDRRSAMQALMLRPSPHSRRRYAVLMTLSVIVAAMGLLQSSTAVVIGAMMIAPLMAPIMGMSASMVMGWGGRLLRSTVIVSLSVLGAIALSWALARFIPVAGVGLPEEAIARSSPDIRDLVVALAAGTAGAYATVRRDVSGALPGVAVAVALVPPLAAVGVLLGLEQPDLARGAGLLFAANLFGILLAAAVVFLVTGFVPERHRKRTRPTIIVALAAAAVPVLAVAVLLTVRFAHTADQARTLRTATETALAWLGPASADKLGTISLVGDTVEVNVSGPVPPPATQELTEALTAALGRSTSVSVRWTPVADGSSGQAPPLPLDEIRPTVEAWLTEQGLALVGLSYADGTLVVSTAGAEPPGDAAVLAEQIQAVTGTRPEVSLSWTLGPGQLDERTSEAVAVARSTATQWSADTPGVSVLDVDGQPWGVLVTLVGGDRPDTAQLRAQLAAALPDQTVSIRWVPSTLVGLSLPGSQ
jgi:uncharacterized hydrophobic protein (TIGR00271 family)